MAVYLPDTALASISVGNTIYTYAQSPEGAIRECEGRLEPVGQIQDVYSFSHPSHVVARYQRNETVATNAPKLFTPLAAVYFEGYRNLFYVDDSNTIRGVKSTKTPWEGVGGNLSTLDVRCAQFSQLAAVAISENNFQAICLYYQSSKRDAGIEMVSYSTKNKMWVKGKPDMTPLPPVLCQLSNGFERLNRFLIGYKLFIF